MPFFSACALIFCAMASDSSRNSVSMMRLSLRPARDSGSGAAPGLVLAGEHAARERAVGHHADAVVRARREDVVLRLAVHRVVVGLAYDRVGNAERAAHGHDLGDAPAAEIGDTPK